ncbi:PQQ-binding-like beta-propeller repeat protein [Actinoplanes oblitus]|uniref:PQQ-binding-like beta-propeller repeat protein n=1 Tax=Actinoplanes oblitus TaxID=3040509 RepID=A0ABY8WFL3_9ACTN|nr:PQQ-binding-like beta-propeller repeat protein [Actinoplanes oblitus]WIM95293.1 PQQ-binding-like beta-propeller repeat protein [Actinoplanes oblitus]
MTLIELDRDAPLDPLPTSRPPLAAYRRTGLLLTLVLLAVLGGAAPAAGIVWRYLGAVPAAAVPDGPIELADGRLYTVDTTGTLPTVSAWSPDRPPARLWTTRVPVGDDPGVIPAGSVTIRPAGEVVLLTAGVATTAVDAATGRIRWSSPIAVSVLAGSGAGVTVDRVFRPGTEYDQESGDPGPLYFSATGEPHTEPPLRTEVRGLDLAGGRTLWTATPGGSVTVDVLAGDEPAVLITSSRSLTLVAGVSGAVLRETAVPQLGGHGPASSSLLGDVALVSYREPSRQVAFQARTLRQLWSRTTRDAELLADPADCQGVLCDGGHGDLRVLDPGTGRARWQVQEDVDLAVRAGYVLETDAASGEPVRLSDPRTGATRVDLSGWTGQVTGAADQPLLLRRTEGRGGQAFAAVVPGHAEIRRLGVAGTGLGDCDSDGRLLACRSAAGLRIWAFRV